MAVDWVNDTGYKRSTYDTESERKPFRPQKASADSTGFTSQIAGLMADGIMEKAMADKMATMAQDPLQGGPDSGHEREKGSQDVEEDQGAKHDVDDDLEALRARRRQQMKEAMAKREKYQQLGHGGYEEIVEEEFLKTVTASERCVVHFYHRHFERCKIVDMHLEKCAKKFFGTRFVKLNAEKTPFFVEKLKVKTLPCVVVFVDGVAKGRQVGFDGLGTDEFRTPQLAGILKDFGGIEEAVDPEDEDL